MRTCNHRLSCQSPFHAICRQSCEDAVSPEKETKPNGGARRPHKVNGASSCSLFTMRIGSSAASRATSDRSHCGRSFLASGAIIQCDCSPTACCAACAQTWLIARSEILVMIRLTLIHDCLPSPQLVATAKRNSARFPLVRSIQISVRRPSEGEAVLQVYPS